MWSGGAGIIVPDLNGRRDGIVSADETGPRLQYAIHKHVETSAAPGIRPPCDVHPPPRFERLRVTRVPGAVFINHYHQQVASGTNSQSDPPPGAGILTLPDRAHDSAPQR